ncbi:MAG: hypothetical protein ACJLS2_02690 [Microcella pacifica]|uniref:Uncharacterized protein n=1 Tax=Microcella pacifica TaxID=2591847 RepID=A0A9E5JQF2_9MICO|nr:hypothetical protein [Microcella pacifica]NHF63777.1 hypothetical protein [Microcella pacifica]
MSPRETDLDPRYPTAFQRGGAEEAPPPPSTSEPRAARPNTPSGPVLDDGVAVPTATQRHRTTVRAFDDHAHFEIVVAGNPWLRALWAVGALALALAIALTVYSEFAFSVAPGIYDPSTFVVPRVVQMLALPLSIAGVVALTAAASLRIVAWRPSGARAAEE